jgi:hypothetical protein
MRVSQAKSNPVIAYADAIHVISAFQFTTLVILCRVKPFPDRNESLQKQFLCVVAPFENL